MTILYESDTDISLIRNCKVAVLGYGAQGRAHALNLRDSGVSVTVGLRSESASRPRAIDDGLTVAALADAVAGADVVAMLVPDMVQPQVFEKVVQPMLREGGALLFAHGYNIHYQRIVPGPELDVIMVAPLGVGDQVRAIYERGGGVPALLAVQQDASGESRALALSYAAAMGHGRAGIIETSFAEETETDLFAEQAVLCGGLTHLVEAGFDTLTEAGYSAEVAYFCCLHEVKLIADLIHSRGISGMRESISTIAEYGDYTRGPRIVTDQTRRQMRGLLDEIRNGAFARELAEEEVSGLPAIQAGRAAARVHPIEAVGARLRARMHWLSDTGES